MATRPTNVSALRRNKRSLSLPDNQSVIQCKQCGRQHRPRECPAYGQECSYCHKLNHFARMCRNKQPIKQTKNQKTTHTQPKPSANREVHEVEQSDSSLSTSTEESPDLYIEPIQIEGMGLIHYSCAPLILFHFPYTLDSLPQYLPFANGAGGVGIF